MKVLCKRNYLVFKKNETYDSIGIVSVFHKDDFITISSKENQSLYRFRMDESEEYVEDYVGLNEIYFYDYFYTPEETQNLTRGKLIERMLE